MTNTGHRSSKDEKSNPSPIPIIKNERESNKNSNNNVLLTYLSFFE